MNRYARVENTVVIDVTEQNTPPTLSGVWVQCPLWVGLKDTYDGATFTKAVPVTQEETLFYVDIGPFFDRFGSSMMAVLTNTDPTLKAWINNVQIRKWIWTKHASVGQAIDAMIALGISGVDAAMKTAVQNTPARWSEQSALIKLYFPEQEELAKTRK